MEEARYQTLCADVEKQLESISLLYAKIQDRRVGFEDDVVRLESLVLQLHNLYCAFEELARCVADAFENQVEQGNRWHERLSSRTTVELSGVRPPLFSNDTARRLDELRRFRHVVRHAYEKDFDPEKVRLILRDVDALQKVYESKARSFLSRLKEA